MGDIIPKHYTKVERLGVVFVLATVIKVSGLYSTFYVVYPNPCRDIFVTDPTFANSCLKYLAPNKGK